MPNNPSNHSYDINALKVSISSASEKLERMSEEADDIKIDVKLLAREVQDLTHAVRLNNKILNGTNKNSILIRMALIEAQQAYLVKKMLNSNKSKNETFSAKLHLYGVTITAIISFIGTIAIGAFSYLK